MYNYDRVMQVAIHILRKFAHVIQVPTREQPIRLQDSHVTKIYIYIYILYIYIYIYICG